MKYGLVITMLVLGMGCSGDTTLAPPVTPKIPEVSIPVLAFQTDELSGAMAAAGVQLATVEKGAQSGCSGGRDCIPRLAYPQVVQTSDRALGDGELVLGAVVNGKARAYPLATLWQTEVINDTLGGVAVCVNFCPLTGTGLQFKSPFLNGSPMTFGVSGMLFFNNLILYDHQTESYWPQMLFTAAWGRSRGRQMQLLPTMEMTWAAWKKLYPNSTTIHPSHDKSDPYGNYRSNHNNILFPQQVDPRLNSKDLVLGVIGEKTARAYPFKSMGERLVLNDSLDGFPILILFHKNSDLAVAYYCPKRNGSALKMEKADGTQDFPYDVKSSDGLGKWSFNGKKLEGDDTLTDLIPVSTAFKGFWLSWGSYYRGIEIWSP